MGDYKYKSGNEGRHHPNMKHPGYWQGKLSYVNEKRLEQQRRWMKAQR